MSTRRLQASGPQRGAAPMPGMAWRWAPTFFFTVPRGFAGGSAQGNDGQLDRGVSRRRAACADQTEGLDAAVIEAEDRPGARRGRAAADHGGHADRRHRRPVSDPVDHEAARSPHEGKQTKWLEGRSPGWAWRREATWEARGRLQQHGRTGCGKQRRSRGDDASYIRTRSGCRCRQCTRPTICCPSSRPDRSPSARKNSLRRSGTTSTRSPAQQSVPRSRADRGGHGWNTRRADRSGGCAQAACLPTRPVNAARKGMVLQYVSSPLRGSWQIPTAAPRCSPIS